MSRRAVLQDWLWRLTHPRVVQERARAEEAAREAEDQQRQETTFRQYEEDRERWLSLARDPEASPEDLRRLLQEDWQWRKDSPRSRDIVNHLVRLAQSGNRSYAEGYFDVLPVAISMHPNIPLDVLGREIVITKPTVTALLQNPIFPLLALERPDFLEMLDANYPSRLNSLQFAYYALRHNRHMALPAGILALLAACKDPWMALEARTHVCFASGADASELGPPDLAQLDGQVIALLRQETFGRRCLLYQLEQYGMIPPGVQPTNPWQEPEFLTSFRDACAAEPISTWLQQAIPAAKRARSKRSRRKWWSTYISDLDRSVDHDVVYQVLASHPDAPYWVMEHVSGFNPPSSLPLSCIRRFLPVLSRSIGCVCVNTSSTTWMVRALWMTIAQVRFIWCCGIYLTYWPSGGLTRRIRVPGLPCYDEPLRAAISWRVWLSHFAWTMQIQKTGR